MSKESNNKFGVHMSLSRTDYSEHTSKLGSLAAKRSNLVDYAY